MLYYILATKNIRGFSIKFKNYWFGADPTSDVANWIKKWTQSSTQSYTFEYNFEENKYQTTQKRRMSPSCFC